MIAKEKYVKAGESESMGENGFLGIQVMVATQRELNEADERIIWKAIEKIHDELLAETIRLDPKATERKVEERTSIVNLFPERIFVEEIPNGYCSSFCCWQKPWFIVTTTRGRIQVGWRKSVLAIDWSDSVITKTAEELFPDEQVTKINRSIHAWGYEKAAEYIKKLLAE